MAAEPYRRVVCISVQENCSRWRPDGDVSHTWWALRPLACRLPGRTVDRAAWARRPSAVAPSPAKPRGTSPSTSPISAGESGRCPPGHCSISADWTSGKTDMRVSGKVGKTRGSSGFHHRLVVPLDLSRVYTRIHVAGYKYPERATCIWIQVDTTCIRATCILV